MLTAVRQTGACSLSFHTLCPFGAVSGSPVAAQIPCRARRMFPAPVDAVGSWMPSNEAQGCDCCRGRVQCKLVWRCEPASTRIGIPMENMCRAASTRPFKGCPVPSVSMCRFPVCARAPWRVRSEQSDTIPAL